jgi:hypothetical protein
LNSASFPTLNPENGTAFPLLFSFNSGTNPEQTHPIIYLIRHGEKPPKVDGKDQDGLSAQGEERAQGLKVTFGKDSPYDIQCIIAEHPKEGNFLPDSDVHSIPRILSGG